MSFGMPGDEFDAAILWMPTAWNHKPRQSTQMDHFPTWSWASSSSCVEVELQRKPVYSLAYWGRITANGTVTEGQYSRSTIPSSDFRPPRESMYTKHCVSTPPSHGYTVAFARKCPKTCWLIAPTTSTANAFRKGGRVSLHGIGATHSKVTKNIACSSTSIAHQ
jgi:hypothetical protein